MQLLIDVLKKQEDSLGAGISPTQHCTTFETCDSYIGAPEGNPRHFEEVSESAPSTRIKTAPTVQPAMIPGLMPLDLGEGKCLTE